MAYKTSEMIEQCLKAIKKDKLMFIDEVISKVPFSQATFYNHKLEQLEVIKEAIEQEKIDCKVGLKQKWRKSDIPTLQVALMKLIGTEEEYHRLANTRMDIDQTTKNHHTVEYVNVSKDPKFKDK